MASFNTNTNNTDNTFYLYVTGIADSFSYMDYWQDTMLDKILEKIPNNFTSIEIEYYDPVYREKSNIDKFKEYLDECRQILITNQMKSLVQSTRITKKEFINDIFPVPFTPKSPNYLIVDLAHIFKYTHISNPFIKIKPGYVLYEGDYKIYNYRVLYLSYQGERQYTEGFFNRALMDINFLVITPDNKVTTWIDHLKLMNYNFMSIKDDFVMDIISNITSPAFKILRKKYTDKWIKPDRINALEIFDFFEKQIFRNNDTIMNPIPTPYIDYSYDLTLKTTTIMFGNSFEPKYIIETLVSMLEKEILSIEPVN